MNILFVTSDRVSPQSGGIARVTYLLAEGLTGRGIKCISTYLHPNENVLPPANVFEEEILVDRKDHVCQYERILNSNGVDIVIVQGGSVIMNQELLYLRDAINKSPRVIPLFIVFHSMPGYELYSLDWTILLKKVFSKAWREYAKQFVLQTIMPIAKNILKKSLQKKYSIPYQAADKVILLSSHYVEDFNNLVLGEGYSKYAVIPNMLTYPIVEHDGEEKNNEVLIVARMDERSKRIKMALKVWNTIPQELLVKGWKMTIVGDGDDLAFYKEFVVRHNIKNVSFDGAQNPLPYYRRASIFMMTSAFEGWPMTLMEAMQNECVPIVFDSFKAVYDIVDNKKNGVIVVNNDVDTYGRELERLMNDDNYRKRLAQNAIIDCQRFNKDRIVDQWIELFNSCKND